MILILTFLFVLTQLSDWYITRVLILRCVIEANQIARLHYEICQD